MKAPAARELDVHCAIVSLLRLRAKDSVIWFHPANGEARHARAGARLKRMGVIAGVPDLVFVTREGRATFVEIKRPGGKLSESQRAFMAKCYEQHTPYHVVESLDDAIELFEELGVV